MIDQVRGVGGGGGGGGRGALAPPLGLRCRNFGQIHILLAILRQNFGRFHIFWAILRQNFGQFHIFWAISYFLGNFIYVSFFPLKIMFSMPTQTLLFLLFPFFVSNRTTCVEMTFFFLRDHLTLDRKTVSISVKTFFFYLEITSIWTEKPSQFQ